jgi:hypothetical protein
MPPHPTIRPRSLAQRGAWAAAAAAAAVERLGALRSDFAVHLVLLSLRDGGALPRLFATPLSGPGTLAMAPPPSDERWKAAARRLAFDPDQVRWPGPGRWARCGLRHCESEHAVQMRLAASAPAAALWGARARGCACCTRLGALSRLSSDGWAFIQGLRAW